MLNIIVADDHPVVVRGAMMTLSEHLGMLRSTCCAAAASRNLHGTQRYLLKTT